MATKALVVAKIAFVLAAVLGFQKLGGSAGSGFNALSKLYGGGSSGGNSGASQGWAAPTQTWSANSGAGAAQGWSSGAGSSYPYARSYDAQDLAYSAQAPSTTTQ